jgi:hypothetical protein
MKKVGIVCDNYKLAKFKKDLTDKGFTDFEVIPCSVVDNTTLITVNVNKNKVDEVHKICKLVELHYKRGN